MVINLEKWSHDNTCTRNIYYIMHAHTHMHAHPHTHTHAHTGSCTTRDNILSNQLTLHISIPLCLFWTYLLGKFNRQQKSIHYPKKVIRLMAVIKKNSCMALIQKFNNLPLAVNTYCLHCLLQWTTWKNFKHIQKYTI
jgi:hypothetical protein